MLHLTPGRLRNDSALEKIFNAIPPLPSPRLRNSLCSNKLRRSIPSTSLKGRLGRLNLLLCRFTTPQSPSYFHGLQVCFAHDKFIKIAHTLHTMCPALTQSTLQQPWVKLSQICESTQAGSILLYQIKPAKTYVFLCFSVGSCPRISLTLSLGKKHTPFPV